MSVTNVVHDRMSPWGCATQLLQASAEFDGLDATRRSNENPQLEPSATGDSKELDFSPENRLQVA